MSKKTDGRDQCSKCKKPLDGGSVWFSGGKSFPFCRGCDAILKAGASIMINEFLSDGKSNINSVRSRK
jgi:hypothetical protein